MTEEFVIAKASVFDPKSPPELHFRPQNTNLRQNRAGYKRHITQRWCVRLAESGLPGSDLAVEYLYGKYSNPIPRLSWVDKMRRCSNYHS